MKILIKDLGVRIAHKTKHTLLTVSKYLNGNIIMTLTNIIMTKTEELVEYSAVNTYVI